MGCQKLSSECKMMIATGMSLHRKSHEGISSAENLPVHIREVSVSNSGLVLFGMLCCLRRANSATIRYSRQRLPAAHLCEVSCSSSTRM